MLSIVVCSRNDNHGENMLKRMKLSLYTNIEILEKLNIKAEYIIVDYNTTKKEKLKDLFKFQDRKFVKVRFIEVPFSFHKQFKNSNKLPMNNMLARNIGIRRSKGNFVLASGIDIIFSKELAKKFQKLQKGVIYRVNRYDVNKSILDCNLKDLDEVLEFCEKNIIDVHFNTNKGKFQNTDFDTLHTNNCGDFQLLHRSHWEEMKGYPELDLMGTHLDTIFEYMAVIGGLKETILDEKLFHIDHNSKWLKPLYTHILRNWRVLFLKYGYEVMKFKEDYYKLAKKISDYYNEKTFLEEIDYQVLSDKEYKSYILKMITTKKPIIFNDDNWGAGNYEFEEYEY